MSKPMITRLTNFTRIDLADLTLWFSYETLVAYRDNADGLVVCKNDWGNKTGEHLNSIDGGDIQRKFRIPKEEFDAKVQIMTERRAAK